MTKLEYKGFSAHVTFSEMDHCFVGHVDGLENCVIGFHGDSLDEARADFESAIDFHLSGTNEYHCKHCGKTVQRESAKQWIKSYCGSTGKTVRLMKIAVQKSG